ncbi:hypothetical protein ACVBEH_15870 [Roseateles sp. GG27B]
MIIPLHLLSAPHHNAPISFDFLDDANGSGPRYTVGGLALDSALRPQQSFELGSPIAGPVDLADLQRFQALMAAQGLAVQPTRMMYDRMYAFERLSLGHASSSAALQDLALDLFCAYQQAGEWIGLTH